MTAAPAAMPTKISQHESNAILVAEVFCTHVTGRLFIQVPLLGTDHPRRQSEEDHDGSGNAHEGPGHGEKESREHNFAEWTICPLVLFIGVLPVASHDVRQEHSGKDHDDEELERE